MGTGESIHIFSDCLLLPSAGIYGRTAATRKHRDPTHLGGAVRGRRKLHEVVNPEAGTKTNRKSVHLANSTRCIIDIAKKSANL